MDTRRYGLGADLRFRLWLSLWWQELSWWWKICWPLHVINLLAKLHNGLKAGPRTLPAIAHPRDRQLIHFRAAQHAHQGLAAVYSSQWGFIRKRSHQWQGESSQCYFCTAVRHSMLTRWLTVLHFLSRCRRRECDVLRPRESSLRLTATSVAASGRGLGRRVLQAASTAERTASTSFRRMLAAASASRKLDSRARRCLAMSDVMALIPMRVALSSFVHKPAWHSSRISIAFAASGLHHEGHSGHFETGACWQRTQPEVAGQHSAPLLSHGSCPGDHSHANRTLLSCVHRPAWYRSCDGTQSHRRDFGCWLCSLLCQNLVLVGNPSDYHFLTARYDQESALKSQRALCSLHDGMAYFMTKSEMVLKGQMHT